MTTVTTQREPVRSSPLPWT